ncbi:hypothetical protein FOZ60_009342 [Perkinsus olseni]|uniref:Uncharacterized protein n=1 Tax=Perkinsus olseni TaxID=32597 RepID=A0A7J6NHJ1_PEROL|nr:hypothetical protein FOZ60_009342 [Perkinsus olseni]
MATRPLSSSYPIIPSQQSMSGQLDEDGVDIADLQMKAWRYKELIHKSSSLALHNHQLIREVENMKFEANRMLPSPTNRMTTPLKTIDENTPVDGLSDESPQNNNRTSLVDLLNELEVKLDTSKGRLKEFSDLPSLPLSTIDPIGPNPNPPPLLMTSQPLGLPPAFQDFQSQSASASPGSWIPRAPPPTLYGNILHWHLGRLVAVIRGLQSTVLSAALRDLRYDGWNEKSGAKLKQERLARIFGKAFQRNYWWTGDWQKMADWRGELTNEDDGMTSDGTSTTAVRSIGTLDIYLAHNTLDQHSTHLLRSAFRLIADLKVIIAEGAAMAVGKNANGWTRAREVEYPAAAQMIRNIINSSVQRQLRSALRNLYRKARGGRLQATLRITKVPPQQHVESEIDGDGESVSPARGLGGGKGSTFLSESSLDVLDGRGTSPRTDEGTSVDMTDYETSEDLGDEGGLIQPVYSRTLQASQKVSIGNAFPWSDEV